MLAADVRPHRHRLAPLRPPFVPFEDPDVDDSDSILRLDRIPQALVILGGGVIGCEYASIFAALGTHVTIVEGRDRLLGFLDGEVNAAPDRAAASARHAVLLGEVVEVVDARKDGALRVALDDGDRRCECERSCSPAGAPATREGLGLERIGVAADARGRISVDEHFPTACARASTPPAT